jgi:hypothetical protein
MKQEEKELLLKDLCGRLPYGVKVQYEDKIFDVDYISPMYEEVKLNIADNYTIGVYEIKPYLFPLSSMTKEQSKTYHELIRGMFGTSALINFELLEEFFNKNHLDYRGLIEKGLANNATILNVY